MPKSLGGTAPSGDRTPTGPPLMPTASRKASSTTTMMPTATIGAVNRPGNSAPRANASAQTAVSATAPTTTGQTGGPPQVAVDEAATYTAAVPAPNAASTQTRVPASEHSCRVQAGRAVVPSRSPMCRRPSRDPAQAEKPAANGTQSGQNLFSTTDARTVHRPG